MSQDITWFPEFGSSFASVHSIHASRYKSNKANNNLHTRHRCDMAFIEPMHRNKPNITYLLTYKTQNTPWQWLRYGLHWAHAP